MKKYFLLILSVLILSNCSSDNTAKDANVSEKEVESLVDELLEEEMASVDETEESVENEVEFELEESDIDEAEQIKIKKEIKKEQLRESPNLGKDCESLLKEYEKMVNDYIAGKDQELILKKLADWANDPIFNKCKKDPSYKDKFYELEEKMYEDDDEAL